MVDKNKFLRLTDKQLVKKKSKLKKDIFVKSVPSNLLTKLDDSDLALWKRFTRDFTSQEEKVDISLQRDEAEKLFKELVGDIKPIKVTNKVALPPVKKFRELFKFVDANEEGSRNMSFIRKIDSKAVKKQRIWDAVFDAHNLTLQEAYDMLLLFLQRAQTLKKYRVLIITGKGDPKYGTGVIRYNMPKWIQTPIFDKYIEKVQLDIPPQEGSFTLILKPANINI